MDRFQVVGKQVKSPFCTGMVPHVTFRIFDHYLCYPSFLKLSRDMCMALYTVIQLKTMSLIPASPAFERITAQPLLSYTGLVSSARNQWICSPNYPFFKPLSRFLSRLVEGSVHRNPAKKQMSEFAFTGPKPIILFFLFFSLPLPLLELPIIAVSFLVTVFHK